MTQSPEEKLKYRKLAEQLRQQIEIGDLLPGAQLPSHAELRVLYGVTQPTVERAYALLEQDRLITRIHRRGIFVTDRSEIALSKPPIVIADNRTIVAIFKPDQSFFDRCVDLLFRYAETAGLTLLCRPIDPEAAPFPTPPPSETQPLGFILFQYLSMAPLAKMLEEAGCRVVIVGAPPADETPSIPCVYGDYEQGGDLATQHLLDLGHRKIVFLGQPDVPHTLRWRGYVRAMQEAGNWEAALLPFESLMDWSKEPQRAAEYFRGPDAPTGVVAWNDHEAAMLLSILTRAGIRVPEEVSLVGYDALPEGLSVYPQLTTVDHAIGQQIQAAVNLLTRPIPPSGSHTMVVQPTLIPRGSSGMVKK